MSERIPIQGGTSVAPRNRNKTRLREDLIDSNTHDILKFVNPGRPPDSMRHPVAKTASERNSSLMQYMGFPKGLVDYEILPYLPGVPENFRNEPQPSYTSFMLGSYQEPKHYATYKDLQSAYPGSENQIKKVLEEEKNRQKNYIPRDIYLDSQRRSLRDERTKEKADISLQELMEREGILEQHIDDQEKTERNDIYHQAQKEHKSLSDFINEKHGIRSINQDNKLGGASLSTALSALNETRSIPSRNDRYFNI